MGCTRAAEPGFVVDWRSVGVGEIDPFWSIDVLVDVIPHVLRFDVLPVDVGWLHLRLFSGRWWEKEGRDLEMKEEEENGKRPKTFDR